DPAITRHLAAFLVRSAAVFAPDHRAVVVTTGRRMVRPDLVLFNGGFFTPLVARERVVQTLAGSGKHRGCSRHGTSRWRLPWARRPTLGCGPASAAQSPS